jgi:flavin-dependent dehydrogenase
MDAGRTLEKYEIVIVGGGIAGLSTALRICEEVDEPLVLIERGTIGDPTRTSPFTFPDVVEHFGLSDAVLQKYTRFAYRSPTGVVASFEYENPAFVTIDYQKACNIMHDRLGKRGNATVLEKTQALGFNVDKITHSIRLTLSDTACVSCSVLVDASGRDFFASRQLGIELPTLYSHPYGEFLEGCRIDDPEEMCIFAGNKYGNGGGWLYPIDRNTARFGFATVTRSNAYPREVVERNFKEAIQNFHPYNEMVAGAKRKRSEFGTIPLEPLDKFEYEQILIVGDAAGHATPWYAEGVRPALESGEMCGKTIVEAYKNGTLRSATIKEFQHLWDARNRKSYSSAVRTGFKSYFKSQEQWDDSVRYHASLTPNEILGLIRYRQSPGLRSSLRARFAQYRRYMRKCISRPDN